MRDAPSADEPGEIGWRTVVGRTRVEYTFVRPGRNGWRVTTWLKRVPPRFRDEHLLRRNLVIHIPD